MRFDRDSVRNGMFVMDAGADRQVIRCERRASSRRRFSEGHELRDDDITEIAGGTIRYALTDYPRQGEDDRAANRRGRADGAGAAAAPDGTTAIAQRAEASADRDEIWIRSCGRRSASRRSRANWTRSHQDGTHGREGSPAPVTREEVIIEHVAARSRRRAGADAAFSEDTVDGPLSEEEVRVSKRADLDEGGGHRPWPAPSTREGSAMLRHEEAEVEDTRKSASGSTAKDDDCGLRGTWIVKRVTDGEALVGAVERAVLGDHV